MTEIIKQEQGRSMVEMLGVLAVVGVLSVGGIAGYTYAMDKHKTNELLNEASKRAVVVAAQIASGMPVSLREFEDDKTAGGTISTEPATDIDGGVGIKVSGVKESVCKNLVKLENDVMYVAKDDASLTALTEADCTGDNAEFLIVFEGMGGGSGEGNSSNTCSDEEKINKVYYTGECCEIKNTGKFCPTEVIPSCTVSSDKTSQCLGNCVDENASLFCCTSYGGTGFDSDGFCCFNPIIDGICCNSPFSGGQDCCEYWDGIWNGSECE